MFPTHASPLRNKDAALPRAGQRPLGGHHLGRRGRQDRPEAQEDARRVLDRHREGRRRRRPGEPDRRHRVHGRGPEHDRGVLPVPEGHAPARPGVRRTPGTTLTQPHGPRSGGHVRRGAMTNHWADMQHCKTILVEGSNVAENHPMAFKWIRKAQENGAVLIHVDPRFTRTSAGRRHLRAHPARGRRRVPQHGHQLPPREQALRRGLRRRPTPTPCSSATRTSTSRTGCSAATTRRSTTTTRRPGATSSDGDGKPRVAKSLDDPALHLRPAQDLLSPATRSRWASASPASRPRRSSRSPSRWRSTGRAPSSTRWG